MVSEEDYESVVKDAWEKTVELYKSQKIKLGGEEDLRCLFYHFCIQSLEKLGSLEISTEVSAASIGGKLDLVIGDCVAIEMKYWRRGKKPETALADYHYDLKRLCKVAPDYKYAYFLAIDETGGELDYHCGQKTENGSLVTTKIYSLSEEEALTVDIPQKYRGTEFEKPYKALAQASLNLGISGGISCYTVRPSGKPSVTQLSIKDDSDALKKYGIEWLEVDWTSRPGKVLILASWLKRDLPRGFKQALKSEGYEEWYSDYWTENKPHKPSKSSTTHVLIDQFPLTQLSPSRITEHSKKLSDVIARKGFKITHTTGTT